VDFTLMVHINIAEAVLKSVLYSTHGLLDLLQPSQFSPKHIPVWLRTSAGHVASNLCSVHTN